MGRYYGFVKPNREAFKKDLERLGITASQLSRSMGFADSYVNTLFSRNAVSKGTIEAIEDRMFAERGAYYTESAEEKPEAPKPAVTAGMGILLKQIIGAVGMAAEEQAKQNTELLKAIRETQAANALLLQDLLQKEKEICTLQARLLACWERNGN